jgi:DNA-binding NtrC family response regulator
MQKRNSILVVDDEPNALKVLSAILIEDGYHVIESPSASNAIKILSEENVDVVITDLRMPGMSGIHLFDQIMNEHNDIPVIFLTAYGSVDSAVNAMTRGAFYYFIKPPDYVKLKSIIQKAIEQRLLKKEIALLESKLHNGKKPVHIIGTTPEILKVLDTIESVKDSSSSVLISGETGAGKELIARAVHFSGKKSDGHFTAVNCAAIPRDLMESELFGFEKGAFTGAFARRIGKIEESSGGTLFLDEIGELDISLQAKLLRVLQENEIERLGSNKKIKVNFRLICSSNRDLQEMVAEGDFREDLFYRINVIQINVPPLRERLSDIPLLLKEFLTEFCARENKMLTVSDEVIAVLQNYHWPGNIRQLKNIIERAVVLAKGDTITLAELPAELKSIPVKKGIQSCKTLKSLEAEAIVNILRDCGGNKSKAAEMLGISRKALYKRLTEYKIE